MIDKKYWKEYYLNQQNKNGNNSSKHPVIPAPSAFCLFVLAELHTHCGGTNHTLHILDAGCGNGRDSYALAHSHFGARVTGIDSSGYLPPSPPSPRVHLQFATGDFTGCCKGSYDVVYSRFTFHSITDEQQNVFLNSIQKEGTVLCMETRSDKSKDDVRITGDGHYRNFTNARKLRAQLNTHGFDIRYWFEGNGVALYKSEDPVCIRVIAIKRCAYMEQPESPRVSK